MFIDKGFYINIYDKSLFIATSFFYVNVTVPTRNIKTVLAVYLELLM